MERLCARMWTRYELRPSVLQLQHTWSDLKRRRPDLIRQCRQRYFASTSRHRRRIHVVRRPWRRIAVLHDSSSSDEEQGEQQIPAPSSSSEEQEAQGQAGPGGSPIWDSTRPSHAPSQAEPISSSEGELAACLGDGGRDHPGDQLEAIVDSPSLHPGHFVPEVVCEGGHASSSSEESLIFISATPGSPSLAVSPSPPAPSLESRPASAASSHLDPPQQEPAPPEALARIHGAIPQLYNTSFSSYESGTIAPLSLPYYPSYTKDAHLSFLEDLKGRCRPDVSCNFANRFQTI